MTRRMHAVALGAALAAMLAGAAARAAGAQASGPARPAAPTAPAEGAWADYDFVPGAQVLFVDDFAAEAVGGFPRRLALVDGTAAVVEWQGRRWLRATSATRVAVVLPAALPERFTVELDVHAPKPQAGVSVVTGDMPARFFAYRHHYANVGHWRGSGVWGTSAPVASVADRRPASGVVRARVMVDGPAVKVFVDERRVADVPTADLPRTSRIHLVLDARPTSPVYVGDVRIAAGGGPLSDALAASGRAATQGILFDAGSDVLRPESAPTLREIAAMLEQQAELRLTIEGHTDDAGDAAANQALSERRAAAVKAYLVSKHGVAADRLQTAGFGGTKPVAPNTTPEGRQQNRRVELVRS